MSSENNVLGKNTNWPKILGQAIFYASIQAAIGSVEMSSRFSVMNFSKDQETLQNAADALRSYMYIAMAWSLATILVMYSQYGIAGGIAGLIANMMYVGWIYFSYVRAFKVTAKKYKLDHPVVFYKV